MLAIIESGGKQYKVEKRKVIEVDKLQGKKGDKVVFERVLLFFDGKKTLIGKPYLENFKIEGEILEQKRSKKIIIFRYKPKTRYRKKKSQRRYTTAVVCNL